MKSITFPKGTHTIIFPVYQPLGDFYFEKEATKQIEKIKKLYKPRKNVIWDYEVRYKSQFARVTVSKIIK